MFTGRTEASGFFNQLSKSHKDYFVKWITSAKTDETRSNRIVQAVIGLSKGLSYGEMIRLFKSR
ncbi:MAG: YdeI/OmpD-associated family protein [Sphingobacteriaceae bacterium]